MKTRIRSTWFALACLSAFGLVAAMALGGCGKPPASPAAPAGADAKVQTYKMTGIVTSIDKSSREITVDSEAIPGFMDAMTMPYTVKHASELDKVKVKDKIAAELIADPAGAYIQNLSVVQPPPGGAAPSLDARTGSGRG